MSNLCIGPKLTTVVTEEQRKAFLDSLSFEQIDARLLNIKKAHDRTCNWLFEQLEYKKWLDRYLAYEHHGFLWIKGKPGAGKSTMMKHALLKTKKLFADAAIVSFFFNARGSVLEKSTLGMYRSLLHQLLTAIPPLQDDFVRMFSQKRKHGDLYKWNIEELQEFLITAAMGLKRYRLVCFIDALDECEENEVRELVDFLEGLGETAVSSGTSLNICLSSRHYPHIRIQKGIQLTVEGQGGHDKDIATYVESKFKVPHSKQMDDIRAEILNRASGVFLWVVLVVQILNKAYDHGQIHALRRLLSEIPDELDDLFADILMRDAETRDQSILCLQWLLFSQRPLKPEELYFAVLSGTEPTALGEWDPAEVSNQTIDRFILSCSKGLAEMSKAKDQTVQFIHESVRDFFLLRNGLAKLQPDLALNVVGLSQEQLKRCCYQYIVTDMLNYLFDDALPNANSQLAQDLRVTTFKKFPFLEYAVHNIFTHAEAAQGCGVSQKGFLREYESHNFKLQKWAILNGIFQRYKIRQYTPGVKLLYIFSEHNLSNLVQALSYNKSDFNAPEERYGSAIQAASVKGHARIVRLLIDAGADVNVVGGEYCHALIAAIARNHNAVVKLLLEEGANLSYGDKRGRTSLWWAFSKGNDAVIQLLLQNPEVDPNFKNEDGQTPLSWAFSKGNDAIIQLLLENPKVDPNFEKDGWTPLCWAAWMGHEAIVQLLLANPKVDPDSKKKGGQTPLSWAARGGHEAIIQLLLGNPKVDPDSKSKDGQTPLSWAARNGHKTIVQLLLGNPKVDPDSKNNAGQTPLSWAARNGYKAIVQLLLANPKVDPNSRDKDSWTPLLQAACMGKEAVMQTLFANPKVDPNLRGKDGQTPLCWAADNGNKAIAQLLLANPKVDPDSRGDGGRTPLWQAAWAGYEAIVQLLLANHKVDPNSRDDDGQTALLQAAWAGHEAVVQLLLANPKVDPDPKDDAGRTPLWWAACGGNEAIVQLLLANPKVDPNSKDENGWTPLLQAARMGHGAVMQLLLTDLRVDPDFKDKDGTTPLWWAARNGHEAIVQLLLENSKVEPDSKDKEDKTPLWWAARNGHKAIVQLLERALQPGGYSVSIT
jgi:ankyrin repeat protein